MAHRHLARAFDGNKHTVVGAVATHAAMKTHPVIARALEAELAALTSPFRMAEAFAVEDIIDPRETRAYLGTFIETAYSTLPTKLGPKPRYGVRP